MSSSLRAGVLLALIALVGCANKSSPDVAEACNSIQEMVNGLAEQAGRDQAVASLTKMRAAVFKTDNKALADSGKAFFSVLERPIDESKVNIEESVRLGRLAHQESAMALSDMIAACEKEGRQVKNLPDPVERQRQEAAERAQQGATEPVAPPIGVAPIE